MSCLQSLLHHRTCHSRSQPVAAGNLAVGCTRPRGPSLLTPDTEGKDKEGGCGGPPLEVAATIFAHAELAVTGLKVTPSAWRAGSEVRVGFVPTRKWEWVRVDT